MYQLALCTVLLFSVAQAAKILGVFVTPSYSHQIVYQPIWRELSLRGHQVTICTPNPLNDPSLTNLTEIDLSFSYEIWNPYIAELLATKHSHSEEYERIGSAYVSILDAQMASPQMQDIILNRNNETYDLFLVEFVYPTVYPLKDIYKCPMVGISSLPLTIGGAAALGLTKHPVLDPDLILPFSGDLSFKQRIISTVFLYLYNAKAALSAMPKFTAAARRYFGKDVRDVSEVARDVSLVLASSSLATQNIKPTVPAFVDISGIHLKPPKPLPQDLKKYLDDAREGVIYFSLGTNVKPFHIPKKYMEYIFEAFSELPYKVLWKADESIANTSNIMSKPWLPQYDILRHPNVKLFITQGGLQSIDEALTSKIPMLMIPFFGDQYFNTHKMVTSGVALSLTVNDFTKEELVWKINELITNPKYKKAASKLCEIAYDKPISPLDNGVWWIEYVLKHNGAPHLRYGAVDLPLYMYYLLDVHLFLVLLFYVIIYVLVKLLKQIILGYYVCRRTMESIGVIRASSKKSQ